MALLSIETRKDTVKTLLDLAENNRLVGQRDETKRLKKTHLNGEMTLAHSIGVIAKCSKTGKEVLIDGYSRALAIKEGNLIAEENSPFIFNIYVCSNLEKDSQKLYNTIDNKNSCMNAYDDHVNAVEVNSIDFVSPPMVRGVKTAICSAASKVYPVSRQNHAKCYKLMKDTSLQLDEILYTKGITTKFVNGAMIFASLVLLAENACPVQVGNMLKAIDNNDLDCPKSKLIIDRLSANRKIAGSAKEKIMLRILSDHVKLF